MKTQAQQKDSRPGQVQTGAAVGALAGGSQNHDSTPKPGAQKVLTQADQARQLARGAIGSLLAGTEPNGLDVATLGAWRDTYLALADAHQAGGTPAVRKAFDALVRANPALGFLVGADIEPPKTRWTVADLLTTDFPAPKWAVPGLVPVGLSFLAGRPKLGKSWLALQVAHAVATGGKVFDRDVAKGRVLFLALEDSARRLKDRIQKHGIPSTAALDFQTEWPALGDGGIDALATEIQNGAYTLVVIDTFSRAAGRADQQDLADMTVLVGNLQRLAMLCDVAVLVVDHQRKAGAMGANSIDDLMGSTGKAAVADAVLGLYKEQGKRGAVLQVTGRDLEDHALALEFDGLTACWQCLGDADEVRQDSRKGRILDAIRDLAAMGEIPTIATIATHTGIDRSNVSHDLSNLVTAGKVVRGEKDGRTQPYLLPSQARIEQQ